MSASLRRVACAVRPVRVFLVYTGLRFGEASALWVGSLDLARGRVVVDRALVELWGTISRGHAPRRTEAELCRSACVLREAQPAD